MRSSLRLICSDTSFMRARIAIASWPDFLSRAISSLALLRSAFRRSVGVMSCRRSVSIVRKRRKIKRDAAVARHLLDGVQMLPYKSKVKHRRSAEYRKACTAEKLRYACPTSDRKISVCQLRCR